VTAPVTRYRPHHVPRSRRLRALQSTVDHAGRRAANDRRLAAIASELETADHDDDLQRTVCRCVGALAKTLKPEYADALAEIDVGGTPVKDYAEHAGITASSAAVRVFRARRSASRSRAHAAPAPSTAASIARVRRGRRP
jgi:DNA-directed RNA polymerase specialized sigma24 family protein